MSHLSVFLQPEWNLQRNFIVVSHFCLLSIYEFYVTTWRWYSGAEKSVGDTYHEFVVWFVIYCILICAFVGQYIEYRTIHCMSNIKLQSGARKHCPPSRRPTENWHRWDASRVWQYAAACTKVHWRTRRPFSAPSLTSKYFAFAFV